MRVFYNFKSVNDFLSSLMADNIIDYWSSSNHMLFTIFYYRNPKTKELFKQEAVKVSYPKEIIKRIKHDLKVKQDKF